MKRANSTNKTTAKKINIFTDRYAEYYDLIYSKDKDYKKECDFIEALIKKYCNKNFSSLSMLDIGCGTGNHAIELATRGYKVSGIDFSGDMLRIAKGKARNQGLSRMNIAFYKQRMQSFDLKKKFDVIICMFAAFDYVTEDKDIRSMLKRVKQHMRDGSIFIFDFWNGMVVPKEYIENKVKSIEADEKRIVRASFTTLDTTKKIALIGIDLKIIKGERIIEHFKEKHSMRYFFFDEIKKYVEEAGLKLEGMVPLLDMKGNPEKTEKAWSVVAVAKL